MSRLGPTLELLAGSLVALIRDLLCRGRTLLDAGDQMTVREALGEYERRGLIEWDEADLVICDRGLPYVRHVAAEFDRLRGSLDRESFANV